MARVKYVHAVLLKDENGLEGKVKASDIQKYVDAGYSVLNQRDVSDLKGSIKKLQIEIRKHKNYIKVLKSGKVKPLPLPETEAPVESATPTPTVPTATVDVPVKKKRGRPRKDQTPVSAPAVETPEVSVEPVNAVV